MSRNLATTLALSAAALFLGACGKEQPPTTSPAGAPEAADGSGEAGADGAADVVVAEVDCLGVNECSGQSLCAVTGSHECGGQNSCKGKGWITVPETECESKGGTVMASEESDEDEAPADEDGAA